jgi:nitrogen fixation protein FixH
MTRAQSDKGRFSQANPNAWRNPWVIGWIALVVVVFSVNAAMVYLSMETMPGLVVDDYYEKGKNYDKIIAKRTLQERMGWDVRKEFPEKILVGKPARLGLHAMDAEGEPILADEVTLQAYRPSDATKDFRVPMSALGDGRYQCEITFPLVGVWDLIFYIRRGDQEFDATRRITVHYPDS